MIRERFHIHGNTDKENTEAYRMLQINVDYMIEHKKLKVITFTSVRDEEGKSKHVCNMALSMAQEKKRVLLIDCDIRNPKVHIFFGVPNEEGLINLHGVEDYDKFVLPILELPTLHILTSGPKVDNPQITLDNEQLESFLDRVKERYDLIFINAPSAGESVEGIKLSAISDGTILALTAGKTSVTLAKKVKEMLKSIKAPVLGVILEK
ncbi:MAG: CpsD/CapB family tyrosine-protein kinase [Thermotaleaceae bacterium]